MQKDGMKNTANLKEDRDRQTWRRLKRIAIAVFENSLATLYPSSCCENYEQTAQTKSK